MNWILGRTREAIGKIPSGVEIAFRRNEQRLATGPTWWIIHGNSVAHIAESYGGVNCSKIVSPTKREGAPILAGPKTTARLESLLVNLAKPCHKSNTHKENEPK